MHLLFLAKLKTLTYFYITKTNVSSYYFILTEAGQMFLFHSSIHRDLTPLQAKVYSISSMHLTRHVISFCASYIRTSPVCVGWDPLSASSMSTSLPIARIVITKYSNKILKNNNPLEKSHHTYFCR